MLFEFVVLNDDIAVDSENLSGNDMSHGMTVDDNSGRMCLEGTTVALGRGDSPRDSPRIDVFK